MPCSNRHGLPSASAGPGALYYETANEPGASDANNGVHPTHQGGEVRPKTSWRRRGSLVATPEPLPKEERNARCSGMKAKD